MFVKHQEYKAKKRENQVLPIFMSHTRDVSGAHFNPAVSFGFWLARRLPFSHLLPYIFSQCLGALSASLILRFLFKSHLTLGITVPTGPLFTSFILEIIITLFLMFVILSVSTGGKEKGLMAGSAIGATVTLGALFAGPISGASMNPARWLAPAVITGQFDFLWLYLIAPFLGAVCAVFVCRLTRKKGCCLKEEYCQ